MISYSSSGHKVLRSFEKVRGGNNSEGVGRNGRDGVESVEQAAEEQGISTDDAVGQFLENNRPHIELGRPGHIDEVGPLVAFLASEKASFINGSNYRVDGGSVASV
jgi:NAD(P)-dependent dehydrogenase (short-subunit alcohol dehydrogenase family)